jgi:uncharacterized membrane protein
VVTPASPTNNDGPPKQQEPVPEAVPQPDDDRSVAFDQESSIRLDELLGTLVDLGERLLGRMPVVRAIYRGLKQVFETLFSGKGSSFRRVGLVEFPSPGMWSIVLISQPPNADVSSRLPGKEEHISVFLPCAPNPTTGFFFYVPKSKIIEVT